MPMTPNLWKKLQQGIKDYPEFFYELFVDPSFSNTSEEIRGGRSFIREYFSKQYQKNPKKSPWKEWYSGPLQLFTDKDDDSRLSGPNTVRMHSESDLLLPEDVRPPLRQSADSNVFYDLRHIFEELIDPKTQKIKTLPQEQLDQIYKRLKGVLERRVNFVDSFMWPILVDLLNPKGQRVIERYLVNKSRLAAKSAAIQPKQAQLPEALVAPTNSRVETINFVNAVYSGKFNELELPETAYHRGILYARTVVTLTQAMELNLNLYPSGSYAIIDHIYDALINNLSLKMLENSETTNNEIIDFFDDITFKPNSNAHKQMVETIALNIETAIDKTGNAGKFEIGHATLEFTAKDPNGNREYFIKFKNLETDKMITKKISAEGLSDLISELASNILIGKVRSNIIQDFISVLPDLATVLAIAHYGSYATPLINDISRAASDEVSVFDTYAAIEAVTIKRPDNYKSLTENQRKIYDLLGNQVTAAAEHALAYRFAKFAVQGTVEEAKQAKADKRTLPFASPKMVNLFKGPSAQPLRVRYLVLEMLRSNTTPDSLPATNVGELIAAIDLYTALRTASKNIDAPSKDEIAAIDLRVSKGEITEQDLQVLMRNTLKQKPHRKLSWSTSRRKNATLGLPPGTGTENQNHNIEQQDPRNKRQSKKPK